MHAYIFVCVCFDVFDVVYVCACSCACACACARTKDALNDAHDDDDKCNRHMPRARAHVYLYTQHMTQRCHTCFGQASTQPARCVACIAQCIGTAASHCTHMHACVIRVTISMNIFDSRVITHKADTLTSSHTRLIRSRHHTQG